MYYDTRNRPHAGHALFAYADTLRDSILRRFNRRKLSRAMDLDDHMLNDIGVTRGDLERVLSLPNSVDAGTELHRLSLERRRDHV